MTSNLPYYDKASRWSSHSRIVARLNQLPARSKVLDVGTATGMLARMYQNDALRFFGVEANADWAQSASPFYERIWVRSIEEMDADDLRGYDAVVLGDVLEHLCEPEVVLQRLVDLQAQNGLFLVSVPNVANLWVRLHLLLGRWDYSDRGILDRTHLRFFTRRTLLAMLGKAGLEVITLQATPIPLELVSAFFVTGPGRAIHAALAWLTQLLPSLFGYQFIVEARKP